MVFYLKGPFPRRRGRIEPELVGGHTERQIVHLFNEVIENLVVMFSGCVANFARGYEFLQKYGSKEVERIRLVVGGGDLAARRACALLRRARTKECPLDGEFP